jgi:hypothetical protein
MGLGNSDGSSISAILECTYSLRYPYRSFTLFCFPNSYQPWAFRQCSHIAALKLLFLESRHPPTFRNF